MLIAVSIDGGKVEKKTESEDKAINIDGAVGDENKVKRT